MSRRLLPLVLALLVVVAALIGLPTGTVLAHNSLLSSDPAAGSTLTVAPTRVVWAFQKPVPLDTMTVTLIDASGVRTVLVGSVHGPRGDTEVITPLPALQPGAVSLRWRLVGADGHPISDTIDVTIASPISETADPVATTGPADAAATPPTGMSPAPESTAVDDGDAAFSTPSTVRWILRYSSYLAIMAVVGILLTSAYVWAGAGTHLLRRILECSLIATAVLGLLQWLVVASDVSGSAPWGALGSMDAALSTDAGMAFAIRIVVAVAMWLVLFQHRIDHPDVYWTAASLPAIVLLGTWAFAGHSRSMRWPEVGVITDVAHHAAAAAWIGGLAIVGWIIIPKVAPDVLVGAVRRFSRVAAVSVTVLVVTGLVQSFRLVGSPMDLFDADHGRYLFAKVAVLAVMLGVANINRRRVDHRLDDTANVGHHLGALRRAVLVEFAIGLAIIGLTAAMVVSPPAASDSAAGSESVQSTRYTT